MPLSGLEGYIDDTARVSICKKRRSPPNFGSPKSENQKDSAPSSENHESEDEFQKLEVTLYY